MSKPLTAPRKSSHASGNAGPPRHSYRTLKDGSCGVNVASPAVLLVVEDAEDLRCCVAEYLRIAGFEVMEAANAGQALAAIGANVHIDLVFTDINMPGAMNGLALAHWLSAHRPQLPVIVTSGEARPELAELARATLHRRFLLKPYSLDALEHDVRAMVGSSVIQ